MSKFAGLAANITEALNMEIVVPGSDTVLTDEQGRVAFVSFLSVDSEVGRKVDRDQIQALRRKQAAGQKADDDDVDALMVEKLTALTAGWHLVDVNGNYIDTPYTKEDARALWSDPALSWLRRQAWVFVNSTSNFSPRSSKS